MSYLIKVNQYHLAVQTGGEVGVRLNYIADDITNIVVRVNDILAPTSSYEWRFNDVAVTSGQVLANSKLYWTGPVIEMSCVKLIVCSTYIVCCVLIWNQVTNNRWLSRCITV